MLKSKYRQAQRRLENLAARSMGCGKRPRSCRPVAGRLKKAREELPKLAGKMSAEAETIHGLPRKSWATTSTGT